jgi:hypothetical protein
MEWTVIGAMIGLAALIVQGVVAFGKAGQEVGKLRVSGQSVKQLRAQAQARRWTWEPVGKPTVPVGRLAALPDLVQRGATRGRFRQREASVGVLAAVVPSGFTSNLEIDHGSTVLSVVATMDAPELAGDLHLDPRRGATGYDISGSLAPLLIGPVADRVLGALAKVGNPAVDVADGQASFLYPSLSTAGDLDRLLAAADDVITALIGEPA